MERYKQLWQVSECRSLPLPDTGRGVCRDQEDGIVEVKMQNEFILDVK